MRKQEEKELMMLVPKAIRNSKDLTPKAKLLLGYLINLNGMEIVSEKGYFYITNEKINKCLGTTNGTLTRYMNQLVNNGLISRNVGKKGKASEYRLLFDTNLNNNNVTNNINGNVTENVTLNVTNKLDKLIEINSLILRELVKLNNRNVTENVTLIDTTENVTLNVTTDTDIESDIELEIEKDLDLDINKDLDLIENYNNKEIKEDAVENTASLESTNKIISDSNDELESVTKTNNTMNYKTRINIETLTARMSNSTSKEELEDKNTKFHKWLDIKLDNEELTSTEYTQQIEDINKVYNLTYSKLDNEPTEESETILDEIVSDFFSSTNGETKQQNTEFGNIIIPTTKTKEQIAADLEDFKNSLASYENKEEALNNLKWYGNKWDKEIISNDMLKSYQELLNYITMAKETNDEDTTPTLTIEDDVKLQLENFKSSMFNYNSTKEAKKEFNSLVSKLDKEIIEFKLEELVKEIYDSINGWGELKQETPSVSQIKPITDTFNTSSDEVVNDEEKMSEKALKYSIKEMKNDDVSTEPKLQTTANTGTSVESKALAMSIFYKKPLDEVMREIEASRAARGGEVVDDEYPF